MVPEAKLEQLPEGLGAGGPGWFVAQRAGRAVVGARRVSGAGATSKGTATSPSSGCASQ